MYALAIYLSLINAVSFVLMLADKQKAKRNLWRISETVLLSFAAAGGSLGAYIAMRLFRHKTRKPLFFIGIPIFLALHAALLCWLIPKL